LRRTRPSRSSCRRRGRRAGSGCKTAALPTYARIKGGYRDIRYGWPQ
jgi:hypothetical protein